MWKLGFLLLVLAAGCNDKLETGYEYKPLNMTNSREQALYADPYSSKAQAADQDKEQGSEFTRPGAP